MKSANTDTMRFQFRSLAVGSAAFALLLCTFQQVAAQNNMINALNNQLIMNQGFFNIMNAHNESLQRWAKEMSHGNSPQAPTPLHQYPITATDFRPTFQPMVPTLVANWNPRLTREEREGLKAMSNSFLVMFEFQGRKNNVASAMTNLYKVSLVVTTGEQLSVPESDQTTMVFNNALAANVDFQTKSPRDKQLMYEMAVVFSGWIGKMAGQGNPAQQREARETARTALTFFGVR